MDAQARSLTPLSLSFSARPRSPRKDVLHDISQAEKSCGCGAELTRVGEDVSEEIEIIPERVTVKRHIYPLYACRSYEGSGDEDNPVFRSAKREPRLLPGSIASSSALAFILTGKFIDHLPFSAMRLARGGPPDTPLVYYRYHPGRDSGFIKDFLRDYSGFLQTDGYPGYETALEENDKGIIHVGCLAHVRRYFCDAVKASRKTGGARMGLNKINGIYRAYRCIRDAFEDKPKPDEQGILDELNAKVVPLLGDFESWLKDKEPNVRPSSAFGKAVSYTLGQWHKVSRFVESPYLTPDNNAAERAIRPFVLGRKNWLFSGSPKGADASCFFYSLIETAKANNLNPYGYLELIFRTAPHLTESQYENLLPWKVDREAVNLGAGKR